ncbi:MAG: transposase [Myxococcota bacterium]
MGGSVRRIGRDRCPGPPIHPFQATTAEVSLPCGGCIETAEGPAKIIKVGRYSIHFAAQVAIDKYLDHAPLERQVRKMKREGLEIDSQTLWDQIHALATHLQPAQERLHEYVRSQPVVDADETHWKMTGGWGKKGSKRWQVWALCWPDAVFYRIADSRGVDAAQELLAGYSATVLCDCYAVYETLRKRGERGTKVAAIVYSLLESAKLCQVHPEDHIREATLAAIAGQTIPPPNEVRS